MNVVLGDLHLSDSRPWSWDVSNRIVDFITNHPLNNKNNTLILLGDLTEDAFLSGQMFFLLMRLFLNLRFKSIYVLIGNHDIKRNKQGQLTCSLNFLQHDLFNKNVTLIYQPSFFESENMAILALPFIFPQFAEGWSSVKDYEKMQGSKLDKEYDLIVGHFQDTSVKLPSESVDIEYLKTKFYALGHIHDKNHPRYVGSIVPNSIEGSGLPRYIRTYIKDKETLIEIPKIMDYYTVTFPDPLPKVESQVPVWTILNCQDESIAKTHYGDIYIRKCINNISMNKTEFSKIAGSENVSIGELFNVWKKQSGYDKDVLNLAEEYFKRS